MPWKPDLDNLGLTTDQVQEAQRLLELTSDPPQLADVWAMLDRVWDELGCRTTEFDEERYGAFYRHVVWLLNGLFSEVDAASRRNREQVVDWIVQAQAAEPMTRVLDYGGGFGALARMIAERLPGARVDVLDPYPSPAALARSRGYDNMAFVSEPGPAYDALVSLDVLEHVPDPVQMIADMRALVRPRGTLLLAYCFHPVIKCHLPQHFHLRYGLPWVATRLGLERIGRLAGGYVDVYRRSDVPPDIAAARRMESRSRRVFPILRGLASAYHRVRR